jgi:hypothetical protein
MNSELIRVMVSFIFHSSCWKMKTEAKAFLFDVQRVQLLCVPNRGVGHMYVCACMHLLPSRGPCLAGAVALSGHWYAPPAGTSPPVAPPTAFASSTSAHPNPYQLHTIRPRHMLSLHCRLCDTNGNCDTDSHSP